MNLHESSRRLGSLRAVELACFRALGGRAPGLEPPSCARWAASASRAHAWRASILEELLPVSPGLPGLDELTALPGGLLGEELARCLPDRVETGAAPAPGAGGLGRPPDDGRRLLGDLCGGLYPHLMAEYVRHLEKCTLAADGAVVRTIGRAVADLETIRAEGTALRASLSTVAVPGQGSCTGKLDSTVTLTFE